MSSGSIWVASRSVSRSEAKKRLHRPLYQAHLRLAPAPSNQSQGERLLRHQPTPLQASWPPGRSVMPPTAVDPASARVPRPLSPSIALLPQSSCRAISRPTSSSPAILSNPGPGHDLIQLDVLARDGALLDHGRRITPPASAGSPLHRRRRLPLARPHDPRHAGSARPSAARPRLSSRAGGRSRLSVARRRRTSRTRSRRSG